MVDDKEKTAKLLTVHEAAIRLKLKDATVRELIRTSRLPAIRIGRRYRVSVETLEQLLRHTQELLTVHEVAEQLHIHFMTVYKLIREQRLPAVRFGRKIVRVRCEDVETFIQTGG